MKEPSIPASVPDNEVVATGPGAARRSARMRTRPFPAVFRVLVASAMTLFFTAVASGEPAHASFPGENGRFAFSWSRDFDELSVDWVATVDKEGGDLRALASCDADCHHGSADWSPNGRRLVYVNNDYERIARLATVAPDGTHAKIIYQSQGGLSSPVWSPDGRRIAFAESHWSASAQDWVSDIYVIRRDGTHLTRVTHTRRQSETDLDWSSRNRLVFRSSVGRFRENRYELFTMRPNGTERRQLTQNTVPDSEPDWAPGGRRLTFVRDGEIWRMDASGARASRLASGSSPTWAPDGSLIAFVSSADGSIHTVTPSGQNDTPISNPVNDGSISQLDWQPR
jgi:Tol biopolymer transport system component